MAKVSFTGGLDIIGEFDPVYKNAKADAPKKPKAPPPVKADPGFLDSSRRLG